MIELIILERKITYAKYNKQKIRYWWYKRKYEKMKEKLKKEGII